MLITRVVDSQLVVAAAALFPKIIKSIKLAAVHININQLTCKSFKFDLRRASEVVEVVGFVEFVEVIFGVTTAALAPVGNRGVSTYVDCPTKPRDSPSASMMASSVCFGCLAAGPPPVSINDLK